MRGKRLERLQRFSGSGRIAGIGLTHGSDRQGMFWIPAATAATACSGARMPVFLWVVRNSRIMRCGEQGPVSGRNGLWHKVVWEERGHRIPFRGKQSNEKSSSHLN